MHSFPGLLPSLSWRQRRQKPCERGWCQWWGALQTRDVNSTRVCWGRKTKCRESRDLENFQVDMKQWSEISGTLRMSPNIRDDIPEFREDFNLQMALLEQSSCKTAFVRAVTPPPPPSVRQLSVYVWVILSPFPFKFSHINLNFITLSKTYIPTKIEFYKPRYFLYNKFNL